MYTVKKLLATDLELATQLIQVWQKVDGIESGTIPKKDYIIEALSKQHYHVFVALLDGTVVGGQTAYELQFFDEENTQMFLYELGVDEKHRQKGVAKALIAALKELCQEKSITTLYVSTEMDNEKAKNLYKATGGKLEEVAWYTYTV